jgi:uncharacterized membrane protein YfcA
MEIIGYICSILIGMSLGMIGSGGSILTVPVLVYLMHMNPLLATTSSLFIVGVTSLVGGLRAYHKKAVNFEAVTEFGIPSIFSIFITRHYLLPALPHHFISTGNISVSREMFLMVTFALLMLIAGISMIRSKYIESNPDDRVKARQNRAWALVILGLVIGVITGLLGAGGGFLIIPTLVLFLRIEMKTAVGTSLFIIAINSLLGFVFSLKQFEYNWMLLFAFSILSITGLFIGIRLSNRIPGLRLKQAFGYFVVLMGLYIIVKEIFVQ